MGQHAFQAVNLVVQASLFAVVLWYTIETRRLRLQTEQQVKLLDRQIRLGATPYLVVGVARYSRCGRDFDNSPLAAIRPQFHCLVGNPTERLAHHLHATVYDAFTNTYFWSEDAVDAMGRRDLETGAPLITSAVAGRQVVAAAIRKEYGPASDVFLRHLESEPGRSYVMVFFYDLENRLYVIKREFDFDGTAPSRHYPSQLHSAH